MSWNEQDVPDQRGRTVVVTGASAGLGLENTRALARAGATVVLATRDARKTAAAVERVRRVVPDAHLDEVSLDLADLASVRVAAARLRERYDAIEAVICNAGLMATPLRRTADGFELQLGVNHLGHAALVADLLPTIRRAADPRIVVVSSEAHRMGSIDLDDLNYERRRYQRWLAYGQSKLANLLYARELQRRLDAVGARVTVANAHPGYARTELQTKGPALQGGLSGLVNRGASSVLNTVLGQSAADGALPQLYAATAPNVPPGSYWGPSGLLGMRGAPTLVPASDAASDRELAAELFARTEALTGVPHRLEG
ncbi:oxidoreductase [Egicoccus halophilus]|uniref:Short-chain dehydrogenase n=1 Tax=Egicoccus halophilus TaxID=1670830 RepID=A0A8J3EVI3_9ACTN|nr:oxidoreductase [Egicoccus halophilus]GGI08194.1 short-chain dehydrogenase [Egicoccus halophilus]